MTLSLGRALHTKVSFAALLGFWYQSAHFSVYRILLGSFPTEHRWC